MGIDFWINILGFFECTSCLHIHLQKGNHHQNMMKPLPLSIKKAEHWWGPHVLWLGLFQLRQRGINDLIAGRVWRRPQEASWPLTTTTTTTTTSQEYTSQHRKKNNTSSFPNSPNTSLSYVSFKLPRYRTQEGLTRIIFHLWPTAALVQNQRFMVKQSWFTLWKNKP